MSWYVFSLIAFGTTVAAFAALTILYAWFTRNTLYSGEPGMGNYYVEDSGNSNEGSNGRRKNGNESCQGPKASTSGNTSAFQGDMSDGEKPIQRRRSNGKLRSRKKKKKST